MPTISVIMGVYNCKNKQLLKESVESIIHQTFTDWEFVICNDGSKDDTLDYLQEIAKLDDRIKIVSYDNNMGLAYALNYALKESTGAFIARQDDDDISYPDRLEKELNFLNDNPEYAIVGCMADIYDETGIWGTYQVEEKPNKNTFLWGNPFIHPAILVRRQAYEKVNGYRKAWETRRAEDYDIFMRMYAAGFTGYNLQEKLYKYKVVNGNQKYRKMKDRIEEAVVRSKGFRLLGHGIKRVPYVMKPIIIGLIPQGVFRKIKQKQYGEEK